MFPTRRKISFAALLMAGVLGTASAAFACITLAGKITVTPPAGHTASNTVIADNTASMTYCTGHGVSTPATAKAGNSVTYTLAPTVSGDPCYSSTNHLNANTAYEVRINNANAGTSSAPWVLSGGVWTFTSGSGCYAGTPTVGTVQVSSFTTDSTGAAAPSAALTSGLTVNGANDASLVCVGTTTAPGSNPGAFSALQVVSL